jgi:rhodanese-related sulfurtransferase
VRSWKENFSPQADEALVIGVREPDEYAVTLTQRVPQGARGFSGGFTLYTRDLD